MDVETDVFHIKMTMIISFYSGGQQFQAGTHSLIDFFTLYSQRFGKYPFGSYGPAKIVFLAVKAYFN